MNTIKPPLFAQGIYSPITTEKMTIKNEFVFNNSKKIKDKTITVIVIGYPSLRIEQ